MAVRWRLPAIAAFAFAALVVAAAVLYLFVQDPARYREEIAAMLSEAAGQPVELAGALTLGWRPSPAITALDVRVLAPGARVTMRSVRVVVEPQALLARRIRARQMLIDGLRVELESASGRVGAPEVMPALSGLAVDEMVLSGAEVVRAGKTLFTVDSVIVRETASASGPRVDVTTRVGTRELSGHARLRIAPARVELDGMELHLPLGVVKGDVALELGGERALLSGEVRADALALRVRDARGGKLIPTIALDLSPLESLDASLRVRIGRLSLSTFMVSELSAPLSLRAGRAELKAAGVLAGGPLGVTLTADAATRRVALDLSLTGADAGSALAMTGVTTAERGGRLALEASLRGEGGDTAALIESLDGRIAVDVADLTVRASTAKLAASDLLAGLMRTLQGRQPDRLEVECAVARFVVRDGVLVAHDAIGAQSRSMNLLGGGRVSLPEERVELALHPWPRKGFGLPAVAVTDTVTVTGPLDAAEFGGGDGAGAPARGGLPLPARGSADRAQGDAPCATAAGGVASARDTPGSPRPDR